MKIEVGKKYVTRIGDTVEVIAVRPELKEYQIAGILFEKKIMTWNIDGSFDSSIEISPNDIIGEYQNVYILNLWLNIYKKGYCAFHSKDAADSAAIYQNRLFCKKITVEYTEGEGEKL